MMQSLFFVLAALSAANARPAAASPSEAPAAIVYALAGEAFQVAPEPPRQARRPVNLFDCLPAGAVLEVAPGARLSLAFATGKRWSLAGGARVTLGTGDLKSRTGDVHRLEPVSALPRLARILDGEHAGARPGAVRGERIKGLYPGRGAAAIASATVLRFQAVEGTEKYRIEVQDGKGKAVFTANTEEVEIRLPAGRLHPGASYHWVVRTVGRILGEARGEADFTTLDRDTARQREDLRRAAGREKELIPLLAGLDRQLGLLAAARDEMRSAVAAAPGDAALSAALAEVEQALQQDRETGDASSAPPEQGLTRSASSSSRTGLSIRSNPPSSSPFRTTRTMAFQAGGASGRASARKRAYQASSAALMA